MKLLRPTLLFWVCLLALLGAATAGAQTPLEASFEVTPAEPTVDEPVTLTDTTKNPANAKLEFAWDLDADDRFDDGTSMAMTHTFTTPGAHRVSLRVRRIGTVTVTDVATRTIVVKEGGTATPTPTPTPSATATPEPAPTAIHGPKINLPPQARIARQCAPMGPTQVCLGPIVPLDKPKTFDASESSDGNGTIVRYQWDLDGNGVYDVDTGASPTLTTTYKDAAPAVLKLKVTDDDGATDETGMVLKKLEPQCQSWMRVSKIVATGPCLRRYTVDNGKQYRSEFPVVVNGITIAPRNGKRVLLNVIGSGLLQRFEIIGGDAIATLPFKAGFVQVQTGPLHWVLRDGKLQNVAAYDGQTVNGLRITGAPRSFELPSAGVSRTSFYVKLPDAFGAPTSEKPIVLTQRSGTPLGTVASADDAFEFTVPSASIGPIALNGLFVRYDGDGLWEIEANLRLPVLDASLEAKAGIYKGDFNFAGAEVQFGSPGAGPFGPVFLQRIKFRVEVGPEEERMRPPSRHRVGGDVRLQVEPRLRRPTFALCGEVGLTGGPSVLGASLVSLDAGLGLATYDDRPSVMRAFGTMKVGPIPFADATFEAHTDGFLKVSGKFSYGWDGFASINGHLDVGVLGKKFNAAGGVKGCLEFVDFCRGVNALVSSKGIAVCMVIDYWVDDWRPGFGYKWGDSLPTPYFSGCSLGPYRENLNRARAASLEERTITRPAGLPGTVFAATGAGAPPKITLVGPKGERISTPDDLMPVEAEPFFLMKNPQANLTQVAVMRPSAGEWKVIVEDGSAPVTSLKVADAMERPKVDARVTGKGAQRKLIYAVTKDSGQTVSFIERGPSTSGTIGAASKLTGALNFHPPAARARSARSSRSSSRTGWSPTSSSSATTRRRRSTGRAS